MLGVLKENEEGWVGRLFLREWGEVSERYPRRRGNRGLVRDSWLCCYLVSHVMVGLAGLQGWYGLW